MGEKDLHINPWFKKHFGTSSKDTKTSDANHSAKCSRVVFKYIHRVLFLLFMSRALCWLNSFFYALIR